MKTSVTLLFIATLAAFAVVLLNLTVAVALFFGLGLAGIVWSDYTAKRRLRPVPVSGDRSSRRRTEQYSLAA